MNDKWEFRFWALIAFLLGIYFGYINFAFDEIFYLGSSEFMQGTAYITILM